ncbi:MAG: HIT family protein [Candidatus Heimdallarchaeota archaeon]|nr:HIT family protein [Candidatus Heimdallarchaeota archaeon]MCG3257624.1 HIT family protein [Candidatus Heimdallarchaeota archaeon]MCK4612676.1 HIT family protein [Candidatus Heimdallarchaeota archaeon]
MIDMADECLICKIVKGELPSYTLYEDDEIKVFLDISPMSKGHSLFVPKKHHAQIFDISETEMNFTKKIPKIARKLKQITGATGLNIIQNNGRDAGQILDHIHFHLVPRFPEDGLNMIPPKIELTEETAKELVKMFNN